MHSRLTKQALRLSLYLHVHYIFLSLSKSTLSASPLPRIRKRLTKYRSLISRCFSSFSHRSLLQRSSQEFLPQLNSLSHAIQQLVGDEGLSHSSRCPAFKHVFIPASQLDEEDDINRKAEAFIAKFRERIRLENTSNNSDLRCSI